MPTTTTYDPADEIADACREARASRSLFANVGRAVHCSLCGFRHTVEHGEVVTIEQCRCEEGRELCGHCGQENWEADEQERGTCDACLKAHGCENCGELSCDCPTAAEQEDYERHAAADNFSHSDFGVRL